MAIPRTPKPFALKGKDERIIDNFASIEKPTLNDINRIKTAAQINYRIEEYRYGAVKMDIKERESEKHDSARLGQHLTDACDPRPNKYCHAHAIVAGKHPDAVKLRAVLAWLEMRIDDPHNGCWLPKNTAAKVHMPAHLKNAVPHSRIHRYNYYFWLNTKINLASTPTFKKLSEVLGLIEDALQQKAFPDYVMNRKDAGLPT